MTTETAKTIALDAIDRAIVDRLRQDGRISNQALADAVGLSPSPCLRRVRHLEDAGVITGYAARIDEAALGLAVSVFVSVKLERQVEDALARFEHAVAGRPEVVDCWLMTGSQDYLLRVVAPNLAAYERFLTEALTRIPGVASIESSLSLRRVKDAGVAPR